ncbi:MAG: type I secretion system permease/ATPase, partial [Verrucomicrobiales bacterium]
LIFDAPTSAMDQQSEMYFLGKLDQYLREDPLRTLVVATHKRSVLAIVNRVVVIENGKVVADGPKDEVIRQEARQAAGAAEPANVNRTSVSRTLAELGLPS